MLLSILSENPYKESFSAPEGFSEISLDILIKIDGLASPLNSLCIVIPYTVINLF